MNPSSANSARKNASSALLFASSVALLLAGLNLSMPPDNIPFLIAPFVIAVPVMVIGTYLQRPLAFALCAFVTFAIEQEIAGAKKTQRIMQRIERLQRRPRDSSK
jgi:hypothetical protein